jgi:hypothetical protein
LKTNMRALAVLFILVTVASAAPRQGSVQFRNGDRFRGTFIGFDAKKGFEWKHDDIRGQLWIEAAAVSRLQLNAGPVGGARAHAARVKFANGDELSIDLTGLDAESLTMDTWFAGKLKAPRAQLQWLVPGGTGEVVYEGPKSLKGWGAGLIGVLLGDDGDLIGGVTVMEVMAGSPALRAGLKIGDIVTHVNDEAVVLRAAMIAKVKKHEVGDKVKIGLLRGGKAIEAIIALAPINWAMEGGAMVSSGRGNLIGRELKWPRTSDLSFDFEWTNRPGMDVNFCSDKLRDFNAFNGYKLRLTQNSAFLYRYTSPNGVAFNTINLGQAAFRPAGGKRKANISLRIDQNKKMISLLIDGKLTKTWRDPNGFAGKGGVLSFYPQSAEPQKISNLRLREWNGLLPSGGGPKAGNVKKDLVQFANGDSISGKITGIEGANLILTSTFGEVPAPLLKISNIVFQTQKPQTVQGSTFYLAGVGRLTGKLISWNAEAVIIESQVLGRINLKPEVITQVQFR